MDEELIAAIDLIVKEQQATRELISLLKKPAKDKWDKFSSVSTFISGVLIASIGLTFTLLNNSRQAERDANFRGQQASDSKAQFEKDAALKEEQLRVSQVQTLGPFLPYLMDGYNGAQRRDISISLLAIMGNKPLAGNLTRAFPSALNSPEVVKSFQDKSASRPSENVANVTRTSAVAGSTILFDGFKNFTQSGFRFSDRSITPWGTARPDIEVANPGGTGGAKAVLFFENDTAPYTDINFPAGKVPAKGGIIKMDATSLDAVKVAPEGGYVPHYFTPELNGIYCVRTWDGQHFAKIRVTAIEADRIGFEWVYQPSTSRSFE